ncbi:MAG: DUF4157 domain-containing protein [ANME-2 cluster archaeon]|nr:MAG: DUF4157 domain-containing protein [ANME-2 cluster archaeon]
MSTEMQTKVQASPAQNFTPVQTGLLQRKCALCNTPELVGDSERDDEGVNLQRSSADQAGTTTVPRFGHDFSRVSVHSTGLGMIQTKLEINEPGDLYEQEADRVADTVMRMPEPGVQREAEPEEEEEEEEGLQTKSLASQITPLVQRVPEPVEDEEEEKQIQSKSNTGMAPQVTPGIAHDIHSLKGTGQSLPASERAFFEPRFGRDFSNVRVHTNERSAHTAQSINARAFTLGVDVVFGAGQYEPGAISSRRLLAHELTHVVQQSGNIKNHVPSQSQSNTTSFIQRDDPRHTRGHAGEQSLAFTVYRQQNGWGVIRGPSGSAGHGVTARGEDGLFYNTRTRELHIADNKSFARSGRVYSATAIDPAKNLLRNLKDMIRHVTNKSPQSLPMRQRVLRLLRQTHAAVRDGKPLPGRVKLIVGNAGGRSTGVSRRLKRLGVTFLDVNQPVRPRPVTRGQKPSAATNLRSRITTGSLRATRGRSRVRTRFIRGGGLQILLQGASFVLSWINDWTQAKRVKAALQSIESSVDKLRKRNRTKGILLIIYYIGNRYSHIEMAMGHTASEAQRAARNRAVLRHHRSRSAQKIWLKPLQAPTIRQISTPYPKVKLCTYLFYKFQDVSWNGVNGFDDEGQTSVSIPSGVIPKFYVLKPPSKIYWYHGRWRRSSSVPTVSRSLIFGESIPVVDLDPSLRVLSMGNGTAAMVFPADAATASIFQKAPATKDNLSQLRGYANFSMIRWIRPSNISSYTKPGKLLPWRKVFDPLIDSVSTEDSDKMEEIRY